MKIASTRFVSALTAWVVVLALTSTAVAAPAAAMLHVKGTVLVNGKAVTSSIALFKGDRVQTAAASVGTISVKGISVTLAANSSMVLAAKGLHLQNGSATVTAPQGAAMTVGNVTIQPWDSTARFTVDQSGSQVQVAALQGRISITGGGMNTVLSPGQSTGLDQTASGGLSETAKRALWIGVGGAAVAGGIAALVVASSDNSPSTP